MCNLHNWDRQRWSRSADRTQNTAPADVSCTLIVLVASAPAYPSSGMVSYGDQLKTNRSETGLSRSCHWRTWLLHQEPGVLCIALQRARLPVHLALHTQWWPSSMMCHVHDSARSTGRPVRRGGRRVCKHTTDTEPMATAVRARTLIVPGPSDTPRQRREGVSERLHH